MWGEGCKDIEKTLTMPVQRVHPRKVLLAALAGIRADVEVQLLVPLAVVLAREALSTPRPLALIRLLFRVRAQVACRTIATHPPGAIDEAITRNEGMEVGV